MSDGKKHDALNRFKDVTGANDERAQFYMESSNWDLDVSIFYIQCISGLRQSALSVVTFPS